MLGFLRRRAKSIDEIAKEIDEGRAGGVAVTQASALEVSVVLACIDIIANGVAVPEMHVMRDLGDGRSEKATNETIYRLLHRRPNEWQTSFEFRQMLSMHAALLGEAFALPVRDLRDKRKITELIPLMPHWVTQQTNARYETVYRIADEFGPIATVQPSEILHIRNMSWERLRGLSAVKQARNALGLAISAENNLSKLHENSGRPAGILSTEGTLTDEAIERLKAQWARVTSGSGRGKTAVLDNGMGFTAIGMTNVDAQALETRRFQVEEICRAFGVFPIMVGHSDKTATYASAESFFAAHNRRTQWRWQRLWSEKLDEFVLDGAGPLFIKFDNREAQLANLKDQGEFFARALGSGGSVPFMTVNEVRELRGLGPIEGGDVLREPAASTLAPIEETDDDEG